MRQLSQRTERSLLLLSSNSYFGSDVELAGNSKELFCNRRSFKLEMKINKSSKNSEGVSSHCLPEKVTFPKPIRDLWRDLQDKSHWKYEQLSPVQLLEKSKLHRNATDIDELARAEWFWSRRPLLLPTANCIVWTIVVLGLPFWLFSFPVIGVPLLSNSGGNRQRRDCAICTVAASVRSSFSKVSIIAFPKRSNTGNHLKTGRET